MNDSYTLPPVSEHVSSIRLPLTIFFGLMALLAVYVWWTHGQLPNKMAVHFNGAGNPDRWAGKWEMTGVMLIVIGLYSVIFGLSSMFMSKLSPKWWNLPNKDYWFAPERVSETMTSFSKNFLSIGICMVVFMGYVHWDVFQANTVRPGNQLSMSVWGILGFVALIFTLVIRMALKFRKKKS